MKKFEMSEEQKGLFDALAPLSQKTCINSLSGMSNIDSYEKAGGKGKTKAAREACASRMLSNVKAVAFVDSMKQSIVSDKIMSRERMMELQTLIADITDIDLNNMSLESLTELKEGFNVKLKAMNQLAELGGYKSAAKFEHSSPDGTMSPTGKSLDDFYKDSEPSTSLTLI